MTGKVYLDANILIAHQIAHHEFHDKAVKIIDDLWSKQISFVVSSLTIDEFLYGIVFILHKHMFSSSAPLLEKTIKNILSWERLELVEFTNNKKELLEIVKIIGKYNLRPRDAFHLRIMLQQKITKIATFDTDFNRISKTASIEIIC